VNTAARMESTSMRNRIQMSKETRDLLVAAGKEEWVKARETKIVAKGKGELQTYWLILGSQSGSTSSSTSKAEAGENIPQKGRMLLKHATESALSSTTSKSSSLNNHDTASQRLVLWNAENLLTLVQKICAKRSKETIMDLDSWRKLSLEQTNGTRPLDEAKEVISFPEEIPQTDVEDPMNVKVDDVVVKQLVHLVSTIAAMHNKNKFHNFAHASHVTQSVSKLLSRMITTYNLDRQARHYSMKLAGGNKTDFSRGIATDSLAHFAIVFSALIHDVDHPGVPNITLVKEGNEMATAYNNQSCAEQNSVDLGWNLLMEPTYEDLRRCLYNSEEELQHFRQVLVNCVVATDIMDKILCTMRRERWARAFDDINSIPQSQSDSIQDNLNRKASVVLEYIIQASDVSHTMQHWQLYIYWNEMLFQEMYDAYKTGRAEEDPSKGWYEGELNFFDFYILPLAQKLKDCGVFGVSGDEYMTYAQQNREEWSRRGKQIVGEYVERAKLK